MHTADGRLIVACTMSLCSTWHHRTLRYQACVRVARRKRRDLMPRVIHVKICADDPQRAVTFYQQAFGWKINKWEGPIEFFLI